MRYYYRVKLWEHHEAQPDQIIDGCLGNVFGDGKIALYPKREAEKKARMFGGTAEKTAEAIPPTLEGFDAFKAEFKPVSNPNTDGAPFDNCMFETYGIENQSVEQFYSNNPNQVFTLIEAEGKSFISSGHHIVNRLGYFITEVPFTEAKEYRV